MTQNDIEKNMFILLSKNYNKNVFLVPKLKEDGVEFKGIEKGAFRVCETCYAGKEESNRLFGYTNCERCSGIGTKELNILNNNKQKYKNQIINFNQIKEEFNNFITVKGLIEKLLELPQDSFITVTCQTLTGRTAYYRPDISKYKEISGLENFFTIEWD